jgi:predicted  nucleic acid-binding Zn-ribbon protein
VSDFAVRFGLALIVVTVAGAAIIISRRNYSKSAGLERNIDAFRLEFQHSIDAAQAATIGGVAKTIRDNISSVIKPIDSALRDLDSRLARVEKQQADATAARMTGAQLLDVRLTRLEEHADDHAIRNLEVRIAGLEKHIEATAAKITGTQKQSLDENERIAARLIGLEQKLMAISDEQRNLTSFSDQLSSIKQKMEAAALSEQENLATLGDLQQNLTALGDRFSSVKQTIDDASGRERDIKTSIDAISSRVLHSQKRLDELLPRLVLGDKAREGQAALLRLFVARIKKQNENLSGLVQRLADLESRFHARTREAEGHRGPILERPDSPSTGKIADPVAKSAEGTVPQAKTNGENAGAFDQPAEGQESFKASSEELANEASGVAKQILSGQ